MLKKLMEMRKKKGFTLIELIVVLVIMAILAAAAIPQMMKYVNNAKRAQHLAECSAVYTAVQAGITQSKVLDTVTLKSGGTWAGTGLPPFNLEVNNNHDELGDFVASFLEGDIKFETDKVHAGAKEKTDPITTNPGKGNVGHWYVYFNAVDKTVKNVTHVVYVYGEGENDYVTMTPGSSTNTMEGA